jgi:hypothetical protein
VIGHAGQRQAPQDEAPRSLRPLEIIARLGLSHEYSWTWL